MIRDLICICCPIGCELQAELQNGAIVAVTGQQCKRGEAYARQEVLAPKRSLTTTVRAEGQTVGVLPVRTDGDIPKELIFDCMAALKDVRVVLPVAAGDVVVRDICGTGVDVIATGVLEAEV